MKKMTTLASAIALAAASASAGAWWGGPGWPPPSYGMTQDQQQAMVEKRMKAREQRMADRQAGNRAPGNRPTKAFPCDMGPWGNRSPWRDMGPWGDMGPGPWGPMDDPWDDMTRSGYPAMPEFPEMPDMPAMPDAFGMDVPQPPVPAFMRDRYDELEAYRSNLREQSKARRDKVIEDMAKRRKRHEAKRFPSAYSFRPPTKEATVSPEASPSKPEQAKAAVEEVPARIPETEPTPVPEPTSPQTPVVEPTSPPDAAPVAPADPVSTTPVDPAVPTVPTAPADQSTTPPTEAPAPDEAAAVPQD